MGTRRIRNRQATYRREKKTSGAVFPAIICLLAIVIGFYVHAAMAREGQTDIKSASDVMDRKIATNTYIPEVKKNTAAFPVLDTVPQETKADLKPIQIDQPAALEISNPPKVIPVIPELPFSFPLPWKDDPSARHSLTKTEISVRSGSFEIESSMPDLPQVTVDWSIPIDSNGRPLPTSADIVLVFPYPTQTDTFTFYNNGPTLSGNMGFTTICVNFPKMDLGGGVSGNDRTRFYYFPESGSGKAWLTAIDRIRDIAKLPKRPVFVTGLSGGGSAANLFADAYPQDVAAVFNEAGRVFAEKASFGGPLMMTCGHEDYVKPNQSAEIKRRTDLKLPIMHLTYSPEWPSRGKSEIWRHGSTGPARAFNDIWLAGVANLRLAGGGTLPLPSAWPNRWNGIPMPNLEACALWDQVPQPAISMNATGYPPVWHASPLKNTPRTAIVVLIDCSNAKTSPDMKDDAEQLREGGYEVFGVAGAEGEVVSALKRALGESRELTTGLPWVPILYRGSFPKGILSLRAIPPLGLIAAGPTLTRNIEDLMAVTMKEGLRLRVQDTSDNLEKWKERFSNRKGISWKSLDPSNLDVWHYQHIQESRDCIKTYLQP